MKYVEAVSPPASRTLAVDRGRRTWSRDAHQSIKAVLQYQRIIIHHNIFRNHNISWYQALSSAFWISGPLPPLRRLVDFIEILGDRWLSGLFSFTLKLSTHFLILTVLPLSSGCQEIDSQVVVSTYWTHCSELDSIGKSSLESRRENMKGETIETTTQITG